jgi:hypothetical protein
MSIKKPEEKLKLDKEDSKEVNKIIEKLREKKMLEESDLCHNKTLPDKDKSNSNNYSQ